MAMNGAVVLVPVEALVWLMPEITLPWRLVGLMVSTLVTSMPRTVLVNPEIVVVPVPSAAPKPIRLPVTANAPYGTLVVAKVMPA